MIAMKLGCSFLFGFGFVFWLQLGAMYATIKVAKQSDDVGKSLRELNYVNGF